MNPGLDFSQFEVLSFDCYGTLIDWESGILGAVKPALAAYGIHPSAPEILAKYSALEPEIQAGPYLPYRQVLMRVMEGLGRHFGANFTPQQIESLPDSLKDWKPFPDTVASLRRLGSRYKLAIISNIDTDMFRDTARHLEVELQYIITAQQVASYKPAAFNFEMALMKIGRPKDKVLHVAESVYHDIIPAKKLGLKAVHLYRRMGKEGAGATKAADAEADAVFPTLQALADAAGV